MVGKRVEHAEICCVVGEELKSSNFRLALGLADFASQGAAACITSTVATFPSASA